MIFSKLDPFDNPKLRHFFPYRRVVLFDHNAFYRACALFILLQPSLHQQVLALDLNHFNLQKFDHERLPIQLRKNLSVLFSSLHKLKEKYQQGFEPALVHHLNTLEGIDICLILMARNYLYQKLSLTLYRSERESISNLFSEPNKNLISAASTVLPFRMSYQPIDSMHPEDHHTLHLGNMALSILYKDVSDCLYNVGMEQALYKEVQERDKSAPSFMQANSQICLKCAKLLKGSGHLCNSCLEGVWVERILHKHQTPWPQILAHPHNYYFRQQISALPPFPERLTKESRWEQEFNESPKRTSAAQHPKILFSPKQVDTEVTEQVRKSTFKSRGQEGSLLKEAGKKSLAKPVSVVRKRFNYELHQSQNSSLLPLPLRTKSRCKKRHGEQITNQQFISRQLSKYRSKDHLRVRTNPSRKHLESSLNAWKECYECGRETDSLYQYCSTDCQVSALKKMISQYEGAGVEQKRGLKSKIEKHMNERLCFNRL